MTGVAQRVRKLLEKAPAISDRGQRLSMTWLQMGIALMAMVSLQPYFMWGYQKIYYAVVTLLLLASCAGCYRLLILRKREWLPLAVAFSLFLIYLSLLPKVYGAPTRWFFLIPFTIVLLAVSPDDLRRAFDKFYWIFALSLIPGMLVWIWLAAGLPLELSYTTPPANIVQRAAADYFEFPGAVMLPSHAVILPNGGVMFRFCGIYDEPGTVGTIAALCLAVTRFRVREARGAISFVAGIMSCSFAFVVLTTLGLLATMVLAKRAWLILPALATIVMGAASLGMFGIEASSVAAPKITVRKAAAFTSPVAGAPGSGSSETSSSQIASSQTAPTETVSAPSKPVKPASSPPDPSETVSSPSKASEPPSSQTAPSGAASKKNNQVTKDLGQFQLNGNTRLRHSTVFSRITPQIRELFEKYTHSSRWILLFGIASNASIAYGNASGVWYSILIDYGIVGFAWLFFLFCAPLVLLLRAGRLDLSVWLFCLLYVMSFYQRPVIWLPAQVLIYFTGINWYALTGSRMRFERIHR